MISIEAYILIGGRSSRFGVDKATFELDGRSLTEHITTSIRTAFPKAGIRLVAASDYQLTGVPIFTMPVVIDLCKDHGPLGGLHTALSYSTAEWIFVAACDMPFITSELIECLASNISSEYDAVVPVQNDGRVQPLCAFYRVENCRHLVGDHLLSGHRPPSLRSILENIRTKLIPFEDIEHLERSERFFLNVNTREDLLTVEKIFSQDH